MPLVALALLGLPTTLSYVETSRGHSSAVQVPDGSATHITREFQRVLETMPPGPVLLDTPNITLETFQVVYTRGRGAAFPSRDLLTGFFTPCANPRTPSGVRVMIQTICNRAIDANFALLDPAQPDAVNPFKINTIGDAPQQYTDCRSLVATTGRQTVFNRRQLGEDATADFVAYPCGLANHLIFVHSELGQYFFPSDQQHVGIFGLEHEPLWRDGSMAGVGRHLLFYVLDPSTSVRLAMTVTATLKADGDNRLPPAAAIGSDRTLFPLAGRGSARVFSPPLQPQLIDGRPYVAIDMGVDGQRFQEGRSGTMALYGANVPLDPRKLTGFLRDVSLVSDAEYAALSAPSELRSFPDGLFQPDLEYSGAYEDGWVSEDVFFNLTQPTNQSTIAVRGVLAALDQPGPSDVRVIVDGAEILRRTLEPGDFELRAPALAGSGRRHVELQFSRIQHLPAPDSRPVAALLRTIGFESSTAGGAPDARAMDAR